MNARKRSRREAKRVAIAARWYAAIRSPDWSATSVAWGRWTPPKRWIEHQLRVDDFTRGQLAFIRTLIPAEWSTPFKIVPMNRPDQP